MRQSRTFRTPALILRQRPMGEADRLLTLLTPHHGKLSALAKGARKPKSRKTGHLELYTCADVLLSKGRDLYVLTQAEVIFPYLTLRMDLERGAYAAYAVELFDRFTPDTDDNLYGLFQLLNDTLAHLCTESDVRKVIRYYELHLLDDLGFRPQLHRCVISQEMILQEDQFFSYEEGGVVCPEAAEHTRRLHPLPEQTLRLLRHLQRSQYKQVEKLTIPGGVHRDTERILAGYLTYLLEARLQSVDFIRRIRNDKQD